MAEHTAHDRATTRIPFSRRSGPRIQFAPCPLSEGSVLFESCETPRLRRCQPACRRPRTRAAREYRLEHAQARLDRSQESPSLRSAAERRERSDGRRLWSTRDRWHKVLVCLPAWVSSMAENPRPYFAVPRGRECVASYHGAGRIDIIGSADGLL